MFKRGAVWILATVMAAMLAGTAAASGKILAVGTSAPDLLKTFLTNAGESPSDYTLVTSLDQLKQAWANRNQYSILTFAYHEIKNGTGVQDFIKAHGQEFVDWVKAGGNIFTTTRDDPADNTLLSLFNVSYSGSGSTNTQSFHIADSGNPVFNTPNKIDTKAMADEISQTADSSYVDSGLSTQNPNIKVIATMPGSSDPAIVAGQVGKGKVVFSGAEFYWKDYPEVEQDLHLIANIIAWMQSSVPASASNVLYQEDFGTESAIKGYNGKWQDGGSSGSGAGKGSFNIVDGYLDTGNGDSPQSLVYWVTGDPSWSDVAISSHIKGHDGQNTGWASIYARFADANNFYMLRYGTGSPDQVISGDQPFQGKPDLQIDKVVGGTLTVLAETSGGSLPAINPKGDDFATGADFKFVVNGDRLSAYVNGKPVLNAVDSSLKAGRVGFGEQEYEPLFKNIKVVKP